MVHFVEMAKSSTIILVFPERHVVNSLL